MVFNDSKYTRWYNQIIEQAKVRALTNDNTETHHVVPKNASDSHKGATRSAEARKKQSDTTKGRTQTAEHIAKRICAGEKNGMYDKTLTPEMIAKRTATLKANKLAKKLALGV